MQKKWKGLRDYFNREKNKNQTLKSRNTSLRKRKTPLLNMLHFLNVTKTTKPTSSNITDEHANTVPPRADSELQLTDSQPTSSAASKKTHQNTHFQEALLRSIDKKRDDPDMNFLLNILPEMKSMTPRQNFDFRLEVMKVIKNIKYNEHNDYYCQPPGPSSANASRSPVHGYHYQHGYTSGTNTYTSDVNMQNSPSNTSIGSSVEDIKAILGDSDDKDALTDS